MEGKDTDGKTIHWIFSQFKPISFHWRGEKLVGDTWNLFKIVLICSVTIKCVRPLPSASFLFSAVYRHSQIHISIEFESVQRIFSPLRIPFWGRLLRSESSFSTTGNSGTAV